jgi:pyruvate formate lyase activating enzyme
MRSLPSRFRRLPSRVFCAGRTGELGYNLNMNKPTLTEILGEMTIPARLVEKKEDGVVGCLACAHRCVIKPGGRGICKVRFNREGELLVPWGYVAGLNADPIEKKPFAHFLPGETALTFGMLGCNFACDFCQNWVSSQTLRDPASEESGAFVQKIEPEEIIAYARRSHAAVIASSYNEPLITTEWAMDIFTLAKKEGLRTVYVSNGFATPEVLKALKPCLDGFKVDLKSMQAHNYRQMGGKLQPVLDSIKLAKELGLWVEVVTLVIPGYNDSTEELWEAARFLVSVSADIPWHVTAFHPMYKRLDAAPTSAEILQRATEIGQEAGLRYVYAGNLPGRVGSLEDTHCPTCNELLIERRGYQILVNRLSDAGTCPKCGSMIAGVWR